MASLTTRQRRTGKFHEIHFVDGGKRHTLRLGKMPIATARSIKTRVEILLAARLSNQPLDGETARWAFGLTGKIRERLIEFGLLEPREDERKNATPDLGDFTQKYIDSRTDLKARTRNRLQLTQRYMLEFFGNDRALDSMTRGDAFDFRLWLLERKFGENTVRKHCQAAKQFMEAARDKEFISKNPFADSKKIPTTVTANDDRKFFVSREMAAAVLDECPDLEWKLIFALARFGGLRIPSELENLLWSDVDWERNRMAITSPKTERHMGKAKRVIPLFAELAGYLEQAFDLAEPGTEFVISRRRRDGNNLRTQMTRIVQRAVEPWPKIFQNLRSSRQTELTEVLPAHVVCKWMGNSPAVAEQSYWQVHEDHFDQAQRLGLEFAKAQQKAQQSVAVSGGHDRTSETENSQMSGIVNTWPLVSICSVPPRGVEPLLPD